MKVYYMNGAGNDFMVIDARGRELDFEMQNSKCKMQNCGVSSADCFK